MTRTPDEVAGCDDSNPFVSVVVPVFDHVDLLGKCLAALEAQSYPGDRFEVIVVDNGVDPPVPPSLCPPHARIVRESQPGAYAARNAGIRHAQGIVLAFTDADCVPAVDWLEAGVSVIRSTDADMVGGHFVCTLRRPAHPTAPELYDTLMSFRQRVFVHSGFAATGNMFARRSAFEAVGMFDGSLKSGGDVEWGRRVRGQGLKQVFAEEACVEHPTTGSLSRLIGKVRRVAGGAQDIANRTSSPVLGLLAAFPRDLIPARVLAQGLREDRIDLLGKARFAGICLLLGWVRAWERTRVLMGGVSRRT